MSALLNIKGQKAQFLQQLNSLIEEAASSAHKVAAACANIQRVYRGRVDRAYIRYKSDNVNTIQRVFRGHIGRRLAADARGDRSEKRLASFFTYFVMQMQRCFRGYYSRKYRSNHADRKKFIGDLEETGRKVREMMFNYSVEQAAREEQDAREKAAIYTTSCLPSKYAACLIRRRSSWKLPPGGTRRSRTTFGTPFETYSGRGEYPRQGSSWTSTARVRCLTWV
jgi:hypothetical protein